VLIPIGLAKYRAHHSRRPVPIKTAGRSVLHKCNGFVTNNICYKNMMLFD